MQKTTPTDGERAVRELIETWMTSTKAGDTQTVLDLMTNDVVSWTKTVRKRSFYENRGRDEGWRSKRCPL